MAVHKLQRQQQEVKCQLWPAIIKYARLRSLFKALKMFCFNKCKSNLRTLSEKNWRYNVFNHSLESTDTLKRSRSRSLNCVIVSFLRVFLQNDLTFSTTHQSELSHCAFGKSTCYMDIRSFVSIFLLRKISENYTIYSVFVNTKWIAYVCMSIEILFPAYIFLFLTTESHVSVSIRIFKSLVILPVSMLKSSASKTIKMACT